MSQNLLIVQRVLTPYRLELFRQAHDYFLKIGIVTSQGDAQGALKKVNTNTIEEKNVIVHELNSLRIGYNGESRSTSLFFYPQVLFTLKKYDIILLEGTTNLLNNILIIPIGRLLGKKIVWWDAGYSPKIRTRKRKLIDFVVRPLIKMTHFQMAYSTHGGNYMENYMGAKNLFVNLNTIHTGYFESIKSEVTRNIYEYELNPNWIKLLYVGVIEERKSVRELVEVVQKLNKNSKKRRYTIDIVGGGKQLNTLKESFSGEDVVFHGPIYDKGLLKNFYFKSDLFVLPGDGGLGILQSLLYGLPVICLNGADGTEKDYILEQRHLLNHFDEIYPLLNSIEKINRSIYLNYVETISSQKWIKRLVSEVT